MISVMLVARTDVGPRGPARGGRGQAVVDGLGHGPMARAAALKATEALRGAGASELGRAMRDVHAALSGTRGAAMAMVDLAADRLVLRSTVVGNVRSVLYSGKTHRWSATGVDAVLGFGRGGVVGPINPRVEEVPWSPEHALMMFSDGLSSRFSLEVSAATVRSNPVRVALELFARQALATDDATLLLAV